MTNNFCLQSVSKDMKNIKIVHNFPSKFLMSILLVISLFSKKGYSQCALGTAGSTFNTSTLVDDVQSNITTTLNAGDYVTLTNVVAGKAYRLNSCSDPGNTSLTLFNSAFTAIEFSTADCGNDGDITFVAQSSGTYYIQLNVGGGCGTDALNHTIKATRFGCANPDAANISIVQNVTCFGDTAAILNFSGNLNDAQYWMVYKDSCGGELLDTVFTLPYTFVPLLGTRKYFVRGEGGCVNSSAISCDSIELTTISNSANFFYDETNYCNLSADPTPIIGGNPGGTFSATPTGISLNATTGEIDLSVSTPNTYKIKYTTTGTCSTTDSVDIQINGLDNVAFSYGGTTFCKSSNSVSPTISGVNGGAFSATPAGLSINASNGGINLTLSTVGTYTVTYTTSGPCGNSSNVTVTVSEADVASITYPLSSYCTSSVDPTPTITGLTGGTFSASSSVVLNSGTGVIDLSASNPGFYNITYTTAGSCPISTLYSVSINGPDNANYNYGTTTFCTSASDPVPSVFTSGSFSATPTGLSINASNGTIDVSASSIGTYSLTYTTSGTCPNTSNQSITISGLDNASFSYATSSFCPSGSDPVPTIAGLTGGTFTFSPFGMSINSSTGSIDLSATIPKTYSVIYTTNGSCPNSASQTIVLNPSDNADFNYSNFNYCVSSSDQTPTINGLPGGTFTATPTGLNINLSTGFVDISASAIGNYTVTYTTNGTCPASFNRNFSISSFDDASFSYSNASFCAFETNSSPTIAGALGGTFSSSPVGLSMSPTTGFINTGSSNEGIYTVTYTTNGDCINSSNQTVEIKQLDEASFFYDQVEYCDFENDPVPNNQGFPTGTYTATPTGLSLNPSTGLIDLSASNPDIYTITFLTNGSCPNSISQALIVLPSSDASFSYSKTNYCKLEFNPVPTITGLSGGSFSSFPSGLVIDNFTGEINLNTSLEGAYNVVYSVGGDCPISDTIVVSINDYDDASFTYGSTNFCNLASDPTPTISGVSGGIFSASPTGLSLNTTTGEIDLSASSLGVYTVKYLTNGICPDSSSVPIEIGSLDDASYSYSKNDFCITENDPSPIITGLTGGLFTSSPSGLSINILTGKIDISASVVNSYTVTYTTSGDCPNTHVQNININNLDDANFNYATSDFCINGTNPQPTISGLSGGTFSGSLGLDLNVLNGEISLASSVPNNYSVTYTTNGICTNSSTQNISVNDLDDANFNYGAGSFCASDANPYPFVLGFPNGTYSSSPGGLILDPNTGEIDVVNSLVNSYTITYTTSGLCPNSSNSTLNIIDFDDATFAYSSNSYCVSNNDPTPNITGVTGGMFSSNPSGLSFNSITGEIDLSNSLLGTYTIDYTTSGNCQNTFSQTITITDVDDASFSYGALNLCELDADPTPIISGVSGGIFSSTPNGLVINSSSGEIDIDASTAGNYSIVYNTNSSCPTSSSRVFNLLPTPITNQIVNACDSININGNYYSSSQMIADTLLGYLCDSIVNTDLTVNYSTFATDVQSAWCSYVWLDSIEYTESHNSATFVLTNSQGCDSLVQLDLTISSVDVSVTSTGTSFIANSSTASYQWLDCSIGFTHLIDETNQTFVPTLNGSFAVIVTENSCSDTSACFDIFNVGIDNSFKSNFEIFPNPFNGELFIQSYEFLDYDYAIYNIEGKVILNEEVVNSGYKSIKLETLENGIYFLRIIADHKTALFKIIKQ